MFDEFERRLLSCGYFNVLSWGADRVELTSACEGHYWLLKQFEEEGYPGLVLYHSHDKGNFYHVHACYKRQDLTPAITEIINHDNFIKKKYKERKKFTLVSNSALIRAIS